MKKKNMFMIGGSVMLRIALATCLLMWLAAVCCLLEILLFMVIRRL